MYVFIYVLTMLKKTQKTQLSWEKIYFHTFGDFIQKFSYKLFFYIIFTGTTKITKVTTEHQNGPKQLAKWALCPREQKKPRTKATALCRSYKLAILFYFSLH